MGIGTIKPMNDKKESPIPKIKTESTKDEYYTSQQNYKVEKHDVEEASVVEQYPTEKYNSEEYATISKEELTAILSSMGITEQDINRLITGEITIEELIIELENDPERKRMIKGEEYLQETIIDLEEEGYTISANITSMEELTSYIEILQKQYESLTIGMENLQETICFNKILEYLNNGYDLDSALSSGIVAYFYTDRDGNKHYVYDKPLGDLNNDSEIQGKFYITGKDGRTYESLTYKELYGENDLVKDLRANLTKTKSNLLERTILKQDELYKYDKTNIEQQQYINNLMEKINMATKEKNNIESRLYSIYRELEISNYIYTDTNEKVEHYMNLLDPSEMQDDFTKHIDFNLDSLTILEDIKNRYKNLTTTNNNGEIDNNKKILITDQKEIVGVISCLINKEGDIDGGYYMLNTEVYQFDTFDDLITNYAKWSTLMTPEEKKVFNYIYYSDDTEDKSKTYDFLRQMSGRLDKKWIREQTKKDEEFAGQHHFLASAGSVFVTPFEGISAFCYSLKQLGLEKIYADDETRQIYQTNTYSSGNVWRSTRARDIAADKGEETSFMYSTFMSMVDSLAFLGTSYLMGGASLGISATMMGSRVYSSKLNECLDKGYSDERSVALAFGSAVAETVMEHASMGHLLKLEEHLGKSTVNIIKNMTSNISNKTVADLTEKGLYLFANSLCQSVSEAEEEVATEIVNIALDFIGSDGVNDFSKSIEYYINQGYTDEEALHNTLRNYKNEIGQAGLGGFISGWCFGLIGGAKSTINTSYGLAKGMYGNNSDFIGAIEKNQSQYDLLDKTLSNLKKQKIISSPNDINIELIDSLVDSQTITPEAGELLLYGTTESQASKLFLNDLFNGKIKLQEQEEIGIQEDPSTADNNKDNSKETIIEEESEVDQAKKETPQSQGSAKASGPAQLPPGMSQGGTLLDDDYFTPPPKKIVKSPTSQNKGEITEIPETFLDELEIFEDSPELKQEFIKQMNRYNTVRNEDITHTGPAIGEDGKVILPEGTLFHGCGEFNEEVIESISEDGIVTGQAIGKGEDGETFYCADFYRNPTTQSLSELSNVVGTEFVQRTPFGTKKANEKCIGFIIEPSSNTQLQELLEYDPYRDNTDASKITQEFVVMEALPLDPSLASSILYGVPSNVISGVVVGNEIANDPQKIEIIKKYFPNCYITNNEGVLIYNPSEAITNLQEESTTETDNSKEILSENVGEPEFIITSEESNNAPTMQEILNEYNKVKNNERELAQLLVKVTSTEYTGLPEGYESIEAYKKDFVKMLIDNKIIGKLDLGSLYLIASDQVILKELIGRPELGTLYTSIFEMELEDSIELLYSLTPEEVGRLFDSKEMSDYFKSIPAKDVAQILKKFESASWLASNTITDIIINLDQENMSAFLKELGNYLPNIKNGLVNEANRENYIKIAEAVQSNFYTVDYLLNNIGDVDILDKFLTCLDKNGTRIEQLAAVMKKKFQTKKEAVQRIVDSFIVTPEDLLISGSHIKIDPESHYNNLTIIVNGEIKTIEIENDGEDWADIFGMDFFKNQEFVNAALNGHVYILGLEANQEKNNLYLTPNDGLGIGTNELTLLVDGEEKTFVIDTNNDSIFDLNQVIKEDKFFAGVKEVIVKSINPKGDLNVYNNIKKDKLYYVKFNINGKSYGIFETAEEEYGRVFINVNKIASAFNLAGIEEISVEELTDQKIRESFPYIEKHNSASNIFKSNQYGGNQSDVSRLVEGLLSKENLTSIEKQKAELLLSLVNKYFPNSTEIDKINLANHYANGGCTWMAVANAFAIYMGDTPNGARIFKQRMGYDLSFKEGTTEYYNLEAIAFDMYLSTFSKATGGDAKKVVSSYKAGITAQSFGKIVTKFFEGKGFGVSADSGLGDYDGFSTTSNNELLKKIIRKTVEHPKDTFVILGSKHFDLKRISGRGIVQSNADAALQNAKTTGEIKTNIGGHAMLVTGLDEHNNILVSSWSQKCQFIAESLPKYKAKYYSNEDDAYAAIFKLRFSIPK